MNADVLLDALRNHGFGLISGVPCSYLTPLINATIDSPTTRYINAANEGEAVAICSGAELGGVRSVAMFQNSGLGNAVSPLTSLNAIFRIPVLLITTWRGQPGKKQDEPQHSLVGRVMPKLVDTMEIPYAMFPADQAELDHVLARAIKSMDATGLPFALFMEDGTIDKRELQTKPPTRDLKRLAPPEIPTSTLDVDECLASIATIASQAEAAVLATTGFTGRALYNVGDRANQLYMVGSMGCISSLALGVALACPQRHVIAIDGDGAFLMRMSALCAVADAAPRNLTHIVLDNGVHDSTGAQATLAHRVDIPAVAAACGYPNVEVADTVKSLEILLRSDAQSLRLIYVRTRPRENRDLPRPSITPEQVAHRLRKWLHGESV
ncbi:MAG: phosphonopyruvate decarboxylase [Pirellula sp.]|jgi:phosphonopyruvate decarboxylase|nr:phosphonopyruvate decarboxylase [Pirellula sp.]